MKNVPWKKVGLVILTLVYVGVMAWVIWAASHWAWESMKNVALKVDCGAPGLWTSYVVWQMLSGLIAMAIGGTLGTMFEAGLGYDILGRKVFSATGFSLILVLLIGGIRFIMTSVVVGERIGWVLFCFITALASLWLAWLMFKWFLKTFFETFDNNPGGKERSYKVPDFRRTPSGS